MFSVIAYRVQVEGAIIEGLNAKVKLRKGKYYFPKSKDSSVRYLRESSKASENLLGSTYPF